MFLYLRIALLLLVFHIAYISAANFRNSHEECSDGHECVLLHACPMHMKMLRTRTYSNRQTVQSNECGNKEEMMMKVCCPIPSPEIKVKTKYEMECGRPWHSNPTSSLDSSDTYPGEFPWLAALGYADEEMDMQLEFLCSGSLINERFVLTAASCLHLNSHLNQSMIEVRLGDWNLLSESDCMIDTIGSYCAPPYTIRKPLELIPHPMFNSLTMQKDIGLIKLEKPININEHFGFLRPICLPPMSLHLEFIQQGKIGVIGGWGDVKNPTKLTEKLSKIRFKFSSADSCEYSRSLKFEPKKICAEGKGIDKYACLGFTGGPLMIEGQNRKGYLQVGIVVSEDISCKGRTRPAIYYTPIIEHIDWIETVSNEMQEEEKEEGEPNEDETNISNFAIN